MAKVTIVLEDAAELGGVHLRSEFDPPTEPGAAYTPAQAVALQMLGTLLEDDVTDGQSNEVH